MQIVGRREQFLLNTTDTEWLRILAALTQAEVNVTAGFQDHERHVFVPGVVNLNEHKQNADAHRTTQTILEKLKVPYQTSVVLEVKAGTSGSGQAGGYYTLVKAVNDQGIRIIRSYIGEEDSVWFDVGSCPMHIQKAELGLVEVFRMAISDSSWNPMANAKNWNCSCF